MAKPVAFIPVRGGSKSIPGKNIRPFCGRPLVYWTARAAQQCAHIDAVVIATDSAEIARTVRRFGFDKLVVYDRQAANARDTSSTESVLLEYLGAAPMADATPFILIQATSPLLTAADLDRGLAAFRQPGVDSVLSTVRNKRFFWTDAGEPVNYDYRQRPRRQDFPGWQMENGAFYINSAGNIRRDKNRLSGRIAISEMPDYTAVELDEPHDWITAEAQLRRYVLPRDAPRPKASDLRLFLTDVDGTLTDSGMYYSETGDELKKFNTRDGKGLQLLQQAGLRVGIITGENRELVRRRSEKLQLDYLFLGIADKVPVIQSLLDQLDLDWHQVAFIGDDVNDTALLEKVGYSAVPADAIRRNRELADYVCERKGGAGCVREFAEQLLEELARPGTGPVHG